MRRAAVIMGVCLALLAADTSPARQVPVDDHAAADLDLLLRVVRDTRARRRVAALGAGRVRAARRDRLDVLSRPRRRTRPPTRPLVRSQMREIAATGIDRSSSRGGARVGRGRPAAARRRRRGARGTRGGASRRAVGGAGRRPRCVDALVGLRGLGIRDVYVYDSTREPDDEWRAALGRLDGMRVFAHTSLAGQGAQGRLRGARTPTTSSSTTATRSAGCATQRATARARLRAVGRPRASTRSGRRVRCASATRRDGRWYDHMWSAAVRATPDVVTITSYNEWHEGTQIEPARDAAGPYASYEGAWGLTGRPAQRAYLDRDGVLGRRGSARDVCGSSVERGREAAAVSATQRVVLAEALEERDGDLA